MEYDHITEVCSDLQAESSQVTVQATTCKGQGYIVAAQLQAAQLVIQGVAK